MMDIKQIHRQAMEQSDLALVARMRGDDQAAVNHVVSAYELEAKAADALDNQRSAEPTRSVLLGAPPPSRAIAGGLAKPRS